MTATPQDAASRPRVYKLYDSPLSGADIEAASFQHIDTHTVNSGFSASEWRIVRRLVHTTGDPALAQQVHFSPGAVEAGRNALRARSPIYVDAAMARAGLSLARLRQVHSDYRPDDILCCVADDDVARLAAEHGLPRSLFAVRKAAPLLGGAIVAIGNAPVALLELNRLIIEEQIRPALVIGMPVGFVHVEESKQELLSLDIPHIVVHGRRGGSACVVATIHALCGNADVRTAEVDQPTPSAWAAGSFAVLILGHGSRRPGAAEAMERIARRLRETNRYATVEAGFMAHAEPSCDEAFTACIRTGARRVLVIPYFLHEGMHRAHDIPQLLQALAEKYSDVSVVLGKTLGYDEALVDLVQKRIEESRTGPDIREVPHVSEEEALSGR